MTRHLALTVAAIAVFATTPAFAAFSSHPAECEGALKYDDATYLEGSSIVGFDWHCSLPAPEGTAMKAACFVDAESWSDTITVTMSGDTATIEWHGKRTDTLGYCDGPPAASLISLTPND